MLFRFLFKNLARYICSIRPISRLRLWIKIITRLKGTSLKNECAIILSAMYDTLLFTFRPNLAISPKSYFSGIVKSQTLECLWQIRRDTDDIYSILPEREGDVDKFIRSNLNNGDVFVDVGSNIGYYSMMASRLVGNNGAVVAIEPEPTTAQLLKNNLELNNAYNILIFENAAWDKQQIVTINSSNGFFGQSKTIEKHENAILVKALPLDIICKSHNQIKIIKIDAEGSEYNILQGAVETLKKTKYCVFECSKDYDKIINLLQASGFHTQKFAFTSYILARK